MTVVTFINSYFCLNLLIVVGYFLFRRLKIKSSNLLEIQYFTLLTFLGLSGIQPFLPKQGFSNSTVKVWAATSMDALQASNYLPEAQVVSFAQSGTAQIPGGSPFILIITLAIAALVCLWCLFKEGTILRQIIKSSYILRRRGKIQLLINDQIQMPFSFWLPGKYYTVIPSSFLTKDEDFKVSVYHEFQHHRQGDTKFIHILILLKAICFLNPFVHFLFKHVSETQELACDEQVLQSKKVSTDNYIGCLIRVAQTSVSKKYDPVCAAGLCFKKGHHILKRRIEMMNVTKSGLGGWAKPCTLLLITLMVSLTVYASRNLVQDRRVSLEEANQLAMNAASGSDFPITVNSEVLAQLNRFLGTPEGREYIRSALERKKNYDRILSDASQKYHTPKELNAIPIAESGYQNLPSRFSFKAAGPWMFIPSTARKYGMRVENGVDERLDVAKETDAAHRYLLSNKLLFNDWQLAIFAYNVGEGAVERGIKKYGTRDVWELSKHVRGDKNYMAKVMASVIIMGNPEILAQ